MQAHDGVFAGARACVGVCCRFSLPSSRTPRSSRGALELGLEGLAPGGLKLRTLDQLRETIKKRTDYPERGTANS